MDRDVEMRIVELTQRDKTLAQKIKTFIGQLLAKLKKIAEDLGLKPDSEEGRLVADMTDSLRQLHDLWVDALADAGKSYSKVGVSGEKGKVQFAERNHFVEDKYFRTQMAKWENLTHGAYVNVGQIGKKHPLHTVGMPAGVLRYDVDKLKKNMSDHGDYLSVDLLTTIPDIIANPVAISEYSAENTVSVFGDVFVGNSPMMVGVTISKDRAGNDISKVRTFNARRDVGNLITDDSILYLDENKKRTRKWFQACGIQVPLGETKFGFIRIISQKSNFVNTQSKKMSERNLDAVTNREVLATAFCCVFSCFSSAFNAHLPHFLKRNLPPANFYLYVSQSETYRAVGISYPRSGYIALAKQAYRAPSADGATFRNLWENIDDKKVRVHKNVTQTFLFQL